MLLKITDQYRLTIHNYSNFPTCSLGIKDVMSFVIESIAIDFVIIQMVCHIFLCTQARTRAHALALTGWDFSGTNRRKMLAHIRQYAHTLVVWQYICKLREAQ